MQVWRLARPKSVVRPGRLETQESQWCSQCEGNLMENPSRLREVSFCSL